MLTLQSPATPVRSNLALAPPAACEAKFSLTQRFLLSKPHLLYNPPYILCNTGCPVCIWDCSLKNSETPTYIQVKPEILPGSGQPLPAAAFTFCSGIVPPYLLQHSRLCFSNPSIAMEVTGTTSLSSSYSAFIFSCCCCQLKVLYSPVCTCLLLTSLRLRINP